MVRRTPFSIGVSVLAVSTLSLGLVGCSSGLLNTIGNATTFDQSSPSEQILASGSLVISRPLPVIESSLSSNALGFWPMFMGSHRSSTSSVDGTEHSSVLNSLHTSALSLFDAALFDNKVSLEEDRSTPDLVIDLNNTDFVRSGPITPAVLGRHSVSLIQRSALWYAPDSYFENRGLSLPPSGSKERYLRGALGELAIFLDSGFVLHSGEVRCEEVLGFQVNGATLEKVADSLDVGSVIEFK